MSSDRTLTALHSPFAAGEEPDTAVLLMVGSAARPGFSPERRLVPVGDCLEIGRRPPEEPGAAACTLDDALASSRHCRIVRMDAGFEIVDLGSKNGTFVDDSRVDERARLRDGALIFVGSHAAVFRVVSTVELLAMRAELARPLGPVASVSPTLAAAADRLRRLAPGDGELLIVGETGVGKEVYARAVHEASGRRGRFVAINCAALPRDLVESELFGYRQGAHSTAHQAKTGLIEEAEGGTLFLDEIGEMSGEAQTKLLRFLQDRELLALGATRPRRIDVRVVAATSRWASSAGGGPVRLLRDDIIGRLGAAPIHLPPLRARLEDLGALAGHFARAAALPLTCEPPAFRALCLYDWPLNVRELEKVVTTALALTGGTRPVALRDLPDVVAQGVLPEGSGRGGGDADAAAGAGGAAGPAGIAGPATASASAPASRSGASPTPAELDELLRRHQGNVAEVARDIGKQRAAVWRWIKKFGLGPEKYRP